MDTKAQVLTMQIKVECGDFVLNTYDALREIRECEYSFDNFKTGDCISIKQLREINDAIGQFLELVDRNNRLVELEKKSKESEKPIDYKAVMDFVDKNPDRALEIALQVIKEE